MTLNSSAPPGQLLYDGWLLRLSPGKAKRARSVNAIYPGRIGMDEKIAHCEQVYRAARLPAIFRITPFCEPPELDAVLARRGYGRFEPTAVETAPVAEPVERGGVREMPLETWVECIGALRGSAASQRAAHLARLQAMPLATRAAGIEAGGRIVATGLIVVEAEWAGLFDILTDEGERRRGHARAMVAGLLAMAWRLGARQAYLQVREDNGPARALYREFGFRERYLYWYRGREGEQA